MNTTPTIPDIFAGMKQATDDFFTEAFAFCERQRNYQKQLGKEGLR